LFRDETGAPKLLFVVNTTGSAQLARLEARGFHRVTDALDGETFHATVGALELPLSPHGVRMLELL
jgi:hypothetical protein